MTLIRLLSYKQVRAGRGRLIAQHPEPNKRFCAYQLPGEPEYRCAHAARMKPHSKT